MSARGGRPYWQSRTWRGFRACALQSPHADRYEPLSAETWNSVEIYAPKNAPRASLFFTRRCLCQLWLESGDFPEHLFAMVRYGLPTRTYFEIIKSVAARGRRSRARSTSRGRTWFESGERVDGAAARTRHAMKPSL